MQANTHNDGSGTSIPPLTPASKVTSIAQTAAGDYSLLNNPLTAATQNISSRAPSYTIREMRSDEVPIMAALWHRTFFDQQGVSEDVPTALANERRDLAKCVLFMQKKMSTEGYCALLAVASDGEVRGLALLKGAGHHAEVEKCYLDRSARGTGLAAKLMAAAEAKLRDMVSVSCQCIMLHVLPGNKRARRFYERHGFSYKRDFVLNVSLPGGPTVPLKLLRYEKVLP